MRKVLLDSDVLSEISKGFNQTILNRASAYLDEHDVLTLTSVSVYEVLYGLKAKPAHQQANRFLQLIGGHEEVVPTADDYRLAAGIRAAMHLAGTEIGKADPIIAACACRCQLVLVTGNTKHYQFIVDASFPLDLDNWRNP